MTENFTTNSNQALNTMRYTKIISQTLSRYSTTTTSQNPKLLKNALLPNSYTNTPTIACFTNFVRECTSSAQEQKTAPSQRVSAIVDEISGLTLLDVADLTEVLRKKLDINEMPGMAVMMPGMGFGGLKGSATKGKAKVEEKKAEKTAFDLKLEAGYDAGAKIKIIKEVRTCTNLGLKEAKDLVEKAPTLLKKGVPKEEAEKIIEKMKEVGAKVTME